VPTRAISGAKELSDSIILVIIISTIAWLRSFNLFWWGDEDEVVVKSTPSLEATSSMISFENSPPMSECIPRIKPKTGTHVFIMQRTVEYGVLFSMKVPKV
jgi:hypothetical protein